MAHAPRRERAAASPLLVLLVGLSFATIPYQPSVAAQGDARLDASTLTANVEFVLDASGSIAAAISGTDQSRMDATKQAMREGESITKAVIMVTDGEDTWGGDPCAVAEQLNSAET